MNAEHDDYRRPDGENLDELVLLINDLRQSFADLIQLTNESPNASAPREIVTDINLAAAKNVQDVKHPDADNKTEIKIKEEDKVAEGEVKKEDNVAISTVTVSEMFPNVEPEWIQSRLEKGDSVVFLVDFILTNINTVPRKQKQKLPDRTKPVDENNKSVRPKKTLASSQIQNYLDTGAETSMAYEEAAMIELLNQFKEISKTTLKAIFVHFNRHYAPTVKFIGQALANINIKEMRGKSCKLNYEDNERVSLKFLVRKRSVVFGVQNYPEDFQKEIEWTKVFLGHCAKNCNNDVQNKDEALTNGDCDNQVVVECSICFDNYSIKDMWPCIDGHLFCTECLQNHARECIYGQSKATLLCMDIDCKASFSREVLTDCLETAVLEKLDERYLDENINCAKIDNLIRCKFCSYAAIVDVPVEINKVFKCENPDCQREVCRVCNVDWDEHIGIPCKEFETKDETKFRKEMEEKMAEAVIRRCHDCNAQMIKDTGCNKLTCRCGSKMCYVCRQPGVDYDHFCRHVRSPGKPCRMCSSCSLWEDTKKLDDQNLLKLKVEAEKAQEASGTGRIRQIGVTDDNAPPVKLTRTPTPYAYARLPVPRNEQPFVLPQEIAPPVAHRPGLLPQPPLLPRPLLPPLPAPLLPYRVPGQNDNYRGNPLGGGDQRNYPGVPPAPELNRQFQNEHYRPNAPAPFPRRHYPPVYEGHHPHYQGQGRGQNQ